MIHPLDTKRIEHPPSEIPYISPSSLKSYLTCSLKYYFEKVLCLPRPTSPNLHIGKAVHEGLRRYHLSTWREEGLTHDQIVESYVSGFAALEKEDPVPFKDEAHRAEALATGERVVRAYLKNEIISLLTQKPAGVEVRLEEKLNGFPAPLYGIIDLVRAGNIPVDFKTTASTPSDLELEAFQHEIQMTSYALMLEDATGVKVPSMELIFLVKTKTPKVIRHVMPPPSEGKVQRLRSLAGIFAEGVRSHRFYPQAGQHCSWCPYRTQCGEWKGHVS